MQHRSGAQSGSENGRRKPPLKLFCFIFGLFGLGLTAAGRLQLWNALELVAGGVRVTGEIVSLSQKKLSRSTQSSGRPTFHPEVRFTTEEGAEVSVVSSVGTASGYEVGDTVSVLYPAGDSHSAQIHSFAQLWVLPLVLLVLGIPTTAICGLVVFFSPGKGSRSQVRTHNQIMSGEEKARAEKIAAILDGKKE